MVCAKPTIADMVAIEKIVESETRFTDTGIDLLNLVANIVVVAATGADAAITVESKIVPRIPHK